MADILKDVIKELPRNVVSSANFEGANIVLYTDSPNFFLEGEGDIKEIVNKIKKRIELRAEDKLLESQDKTEKIIKQLVDKEAEITNVLFDAQRSIVVIEAKKPGLVIGKDGNILREIKQKTFWISQVQRSPAIDSKITENIRAVLYENNNQRKKFLNDIGKKIYEEWNPEKIEEWVRISFLGGGRQVGRSCILLSTPQSKILLDCGIDPASSRNEDKFPYLDVPEFKIDEIDAIILSHAHLDHCLPPNFPVLTEKGYKKIDEINVGENIISMDWKTGEYIMSKCTEKTRTTGHKNVLRIRTPYSNIESSPNHRFFIFENLKLKEVEASELKKDVLLPSNLLHKQNINGEKVELNNNIPYDKRRNDNVLLPKELTAELAEFIAYFIGDGHKSSGFSLRLTDSSLQILNHHKDLIKNIFNYNAKIRHHPDKSKNAFILEVNNIKIIRFLENNFPEMFLDTLHKLVPEKIKNSLQNIRRAFIRGFADAEGCVTNTVKICSFSKKMLEDMQYLFSLDGIPSNIKNDNTICLNTQLSINKFLMNIGFSIDYKLEKLKNISKSSQFKKQDLIPITPENLRKILKEAGMLGKVHNSPKLSEALPMCLLDLFKRKSGYATRDTIIQLISLLELRKQSLIHISDNSGLYALRQLLSLTRQEISLSTGLKISQVQQIEENRISIEFSQKISPILASFMKEKLFSVISSIENNISILNSLLSLNVVWERITNIEEKDNPYPYLVDIEVDNHNFIAGNIIVHNSGLLPYLFKMGYRGPVYMTTATRDTASLLALDFIGVAYKQAAKPLFSSTDIKEMVKHTVCLNFNEVTDIAPDIRITLYNAGHILGSTMVHINIGNGLHNFLYTGDFKFGKTRLLNPANTLFPRLETAMIEATYGSKDDILPPREEVEKQLINKVKEVIERKGKVLIPELGSGRAQETMLILDEAMKNNLLPKIPIYIEGMIWDINAIHTAYPDFLNSTLRQQIFQGENPFVSDTFKRVGSAQERKEVVEGGPCVVLATSGMLVGGASVEYFREFAGNKNNCIMFVCYQGSGSLGRQVQDGLKELEMQNDGMKESVKVNMEVITMYGFTAHSGRNELLAFMNRCAPKPKRVIINHGEQSKCLDLASTIYKLNHCETNTPRNLETLRLR